MACETCETVIAVPIIDTDKFIDITFDEARQQKFALGRAEHGPVFLRNPIREIDMELIDAMNYADEAIRQGFDARAVAEIQSKLQEVDRLVRALYHSS